MFLSELSEKPLSSPDLENLLKLYDGVETFVLFIGYPRSRSSLVGALLDAHPEIIIPHEYNVIGNWERIKSETYNQERLQKYILFHELYQLSTRQAMFGFRAKSGFHTRGVEYSYHVPGLWQGRYQNKIKVYCKSGKPIAKCRGA